MLSALSSTRALEIGAGTSCSAIRFAHAVRDIGGRVTTFGIDEVRVARARRTIERAGVQGHMDVVRSDGAELLAGTPDASVRFVLLGAERSAYAVRLRRLCSLPGVLALVEQYRVTKPPRVGAVRSSRPEHTGRHSAPYPRCATYQAYASAIPSRRPMHGVQPRAVIRETSRTLRGVPSGWASSHSMAPW